MATVEHSTYTTVERIPLERRISEIMDEKGDAFSIRAFSERIGINRETLRRMITGDRRISPVELNQIALGLGVTVERLRQTDTESKEHELTKLLKASSSTKTMMLHALSLANELVGVAKGVTERGYALNNLGRVQFLQQQYNEAHQSWLAALELAKKLVNQYGDKYLLQLVTANLMLTYTIRKEYTSIEEELVLVEKTFSDNPHALGMVFFARMNMENDRGNFVLAKKHAYRSLGYFEETNENKLVGKALINVAHFEYHFQNYKTAARALSNAIIFLEQHRSLLVIAIKNYVKTLIKLQDKESAIQIIEQYDLIAREYPESWAKLQILYTVLVDNPSYAEQICEDSNMSMDVRFHACKCLTEHYSKKGDAEKVLNYYNKAKIFASSKNEFFEQGGF